MVVLDIGVSVPGDLARPTPVRKLGLDRIAELLRLVSGRRAAASAVAALYRQTGGDPRRVLALLLAALCDGRPTDEFLRDAGPEPPATIRGVFRQEGDYWTLGYEGRTVRLRDARGLHYLALLLRSPGRSLDVSEIVRAGGKKRPTVDQEHARQAVTKGIKLVLVRLRECHPELAAHLGGTVRRGTFCRYLPDVDHPVEWET